MLDKQKKRTSHRQLFLVNKTAPFQFVEAYKSLRTNLEFLSSTSNCKVIMITSSVPEEGKSNVAINLAITLASSNDKRVALVDCDMRKASISRYLHIRKDHVGFSNVIVGNATLTEALIHFKDVNITVLPVGPLPPNPSEMLASDAARASMESLKNAFDYIILDTPPVSVVTDAAVISRLVDGALLVVRPGVTTIQGAQLSKKKLEAVQTRLLGVVMNGYDAKKSNKKDGYYYSYNSYNSYDESDATYVDGKEKLSPPK
ncbi:MAG: CpsD/CapB family tyrosine-protein kinase [Gemmiger sp.]|nr:CpsD/CapB family tyrosine-protein kinase [Gemmiger sp.]